VKGEKMSLPESNQVKKLSYKKYVIKNIPWEKNTVRQKKYKEGFIFFNWLMAGYFLFLPACRQSTEVHHQEAEVPAAASVSLSTRGQELVGLKTEVATRRDYLIPLRAAGRVVFNPKNYTVVVARGAGRVEEILAYEGDWVEKGQVLLRLYSAEHQALQAEYLQAKERVSRAQGTDKELAERMLGSITRRLKLLGVGDEEIKALEGEGRSGEFLAIRSSLAGRIINRSVNNGEYVETGREFFRVADLSLVWVEVNVFEKDLAKLNIPSDCEVKVEAFPGQIFKGRVTLLADVMDEATRTFQLRAEVRNPGFRLKPGMYVDVYLLPREKEKILAVPERAVRHFETEEAIFIQTGPESFSLRPVKLGRSFEGLVEIMEGLDEGETYVTDGSFNLKSEFLKKTLEGEGHEHKH